MNWLAIGNVHMQASFQLSKAVGKCGIALGAIGLASPLLTAELSCEPYASAWSSGHRSAMRLIAAAGDPGQSFVRAGVEIRLDPGVLTYWRTPGEAGSPPVFAFEGSENVADIAVLYPAPVRIDEFGTEVFGYQEEVIFPIHVTPKDAARPALVALTLRYAVCGQICLPAKAEAKLALPPLQAPLQAAAIGARGAGDAAIAAAEAKAPVRLTPLERDARIAIKRAKEASPPTWRVAVRGGVEERRDGAQDLVARDLFVEAPDGWYFETRKSDRPNEFLIVEVERPRTAAGAFPPVIMTLTQPPRNVEFTIDLDAASASP